MRILIRRPHAYFFIDESFAQQGGISGASPAGCELANGTIAPLPGVYFLNESGTVLDRVPLAVPTAVDSLLGAMRAHGS